MTSVLWSSKRVAVEIFGAREAKEIRTVIQRLARLAQAGTTDFRYKRIGGLWFFDPTSFATEAGGEPPKRHVTRLQAVVMGRREGQG
jgi:hypothetical protein